MNCACLQRLLLDLSVYMCVYKGRWRFSVPNLCGSDTRLGSFREHMYVLRLKTIATVHEVLLWKCRSLVVSRLVLPDKKASSVRGCFTTVADGLGISFVQVCDKNVEAWLVPAVTFGSGGLLFRGTILLCTPFLKISG